MAMTRCMARPTNSPALLRAPACANSPCGPVRGEYHLSTVVLWRALVLLWLGCAAVLADGNCSNTTVEVVSFMRTMKVMEKNLNAIVAGFNASLFSKHRQRANHVHVDFSTPTFEQLHNTTYIEQVFTKNSSRLLVALGPLGSVHINRFLPLLTKHNVVAFGPISTGILGHEWDPHLYFLSASPAADLLTLIRYAVGHLRVQRLAFMYLRGFAFGDQEYNLTVSVLAHLNREVSGVFDVASSLSVAAADDVFNAAWAAFAAAHPQAVLFFGYPRADAFKFLAYLLSDKRTAGAYVLAPGSLGFVADLVFRAELQARGLSFRPGQLIYTGWNPLARETRYKAVVNFQRDMTEYLSTNGSQYGYNDSKYYLKHDSEGELMMHGWIIGEVLKQAVSSSEWVRNQSTFIESLYNQRRYVVDDLVFGDFGWNCEGDAARHGAVCHCNEGGKTVYLKRALGDGRNEPLKEGFAKLGMGGCLNEARRLYAPLNGLFIDMADDGTASRASKVLCAAASALNGDGRLGHYDRLFLQCVGATVDSAVQVLEEERATRVVTAVFGVVTDALLDTPGVTFIDPMPLAPRLADGRRNVIHLSPTLEQQLFVLAEYLSSERTRGLHAVIRGSEGAAIADVLSTTLWTHGVASLSSVLLREGEPLEGHLPGGGDVLVAGVSPGDARVLASHLDRHSDARVLVCFSDLALRYDEFVGAFGRGGSSARLLFATNLPHWNDTAATSETARMFAASAGELRLPRTPLAMLGFATGRLMQEILPLMQAVNARTLAQFFYTNIAVTADDMRYGPFSDSECGALQEAGGRNCAVNYGAAHVAVWSMARALDPAVPEARAPVTRALVYREQLYLGMKLPAFMGVLVGFLMLMSALCFLMYAHFWRRDARDNRNAPKVLTAPVTLVFTDIESSTAQWAANPQLMPDAVATHHRLIRALIARHGCYEVKTIGDSFMIACKSAFAAAQLVQDIQRQFLEYDWGTDAIDECYRALEEERAEEDPEYVPATARLEPEVYRRLWNGLRVRAGVHAGLCDIRHDEVTKGYDYYGGTSNTAARTESVAHGGQVLLTRAAYMALSASEREQLDVTPLGTVPLRGVPVPVEMFQLNVVPGRTFRPLRLDAELIEDDIISLVSDSGRGSLELGRAAKMVAISLHTLLGTFTPVERRKVLLSCCEQWRVPAPGRRPCDWGEDACADIINRIASVVGNVAEPKMKSVVERELCTVASHECYSLHNTSASDKVSST
ncbi:Periplasmic binding protein Adenylate and Guanylate cyclase catalytic domain [Trypanosoma vivax]|nr:Periplasmic binding protein Adenylate and Guanylate cyclase catalytic domain [Trypanosoma vivax]